MFDVPLCDDCGVKFDALQGVADALGEQMPLSIVVKELCTTCLYVMKAAVGM